MEKFNNIDYVGFNDDQVNALRDLFFALKGEVSEEAGEQFTFDRFMEIKANEYRDKTAEEIRSEIPSTDDQS